MSSKVLAVALMTVHKSKGLEFHTMIFYGLDNQTWWSLTPQRGEELNTFLLPLPEQSSVRFSPSALSEGMLLAGYSNYWPRRVETIDGTTILGTT